MVVFKIKCAIGFIIMVASTIYILQNQRPSKELDTPENISKYRTRQLISYVALTIGIIMFIGSFHGDFFKEF